MVVTGINVSGIQFGETGFDAPNLSELYVTYFKDTLYVVSEEPPVGIFFVDDSANQFSLYPNPSQESFRLSSSDFIIQKIQLFDLTGKVVSSISCNSTDIEFGSQLAAGFYVARIFAGNHVFDLKLHKL
jgi:hypothetical protein